MTAISPECLAAIADHLLWLVRDPAGTRANLTGAKLTWANLTGANLTGADLTDANLTDANLIWANLSWANLSWANLIWANLTGANLTEANLTEANLTGANLTGAKLTDANLTGANLTDANLTDANLTDANLTDANLTGAKLPEGWLWWQGGASGPYRRQTYVWRPGADAELCAGQGCIQGTPDQVRWGLGRRAVQWAAEHGNELANLWLAESLDALDTGARYIERRAAVAS